MPKFVARMSRHPVKLMLVAVAATATPFVVASLRSDVATTKVLDSMSTTIAPTTAILKAETAVIQTPNGCFGIAAQMLASELSVKALKSHYANVAQPEHRASVVSHSMAWSSLGDFWIGDLSSDRAPVRVAPKSDIGMPTLVRHLLSQWTILPSGVRRVVLYRTFPLDGTLDLRCIGA